MRINQFAILPEISVSNMAIRLIFRNVLLNVGILFMLFGLIYSPETQAAPSGSCWVSANKLSFGMVNSKGTSSNTNATVTCQVDHQTKPVNTAVCFYFQPGEPALSNNRRRLISDTWEFAYLSYDLFYDPALSQRIDTHINPSTLKCVYKVVAVNENKVVYNIPIYGKIYAGQNVKADHYKSYNIPMSMLYAFSENKVPTVADVITENKQANNNFEIDTNYENSCVLNNMPDLNFGQVSDLNHSVSSSTSISLLCPTNTTWRVSLDNGLNYNGSTRRMRNGNQYIPYGLYRSADLSQPWESTGDSQGTGTSGMQQISIYGKVPAQALIIPAGDYVDTVTVTLTY